MKRRIRILSLTYAIAGVIMLAGFTFCQYKKAEQYDRILSANYRHAFSELVDGVNGISTGLEKSLYSGSGSVLAANCASVFADAQTAQMALGALPFDSELEKTASFLSSAGDYAYVLAKTVPDRCSEDQLDGLRSLSEAADSVSEALNEIMAGLESGDITVSDIRTYDKDIDIQSLDDGMKNMESDLPQMPTLIYDGPFSSHVTSMKPAFLEGKDTISEKDAVKIASRVIGIDESALTLTGGRDGNLPANIIEGQDKYGQVYITVTLNGGVVLEIARRYESLDAGITQEDAVKIAKGFLDRAGFENMTESYYETVSNICTINFAYLQDDVICYPDLIKVSVALDTGAVTGFESLGYVMSHGERSIPEIKISEEAAQKAVSPFLKILSHDMAIIPTDGKYELFCHEFKCENADGKHYIAYVDAQTGKEVKLLILLESESGTLAL